MYPITASVLLFFFCLSASAQIARPAMRPIERLDFPSFGISVPVPKGYARDADSGASITWFIPEGVADKPTTRAILVDLRPREDKPIDQHVAAFARDEKMRINRDPARWGDRPATELLRAEPAPANGMVAVRMMVLEREGWVFRLVYLSTARHAGDLEAYTAIASATRWLPVAGAASGVAPTAPFIALPNEMVVAIPDPFRPQIGDPAKWVRSWFATDLVKRNFAARLTVIPLPPGDDKRTLESPQAEFERHMLPALEAKGPLQWRRVGEGAAPVIFSKSARFASKQGQSTALVALKSDNSATVFLLSTQVDEKDLAAMEKTLDLLRESILHATTSAPPR